MCEIEPLFSTSVMCFTVFYAQALPLCLVRFSKLPPYMLITPWLWDPSKIGIYFLF